MATDFYSQENKGPFELFPLGNWQLELGGTLRDAKLAFRTFGKLNEDKKNAILFPHMYSGTGKEIERFVGEGLALDPTKYFVIIVDQIGNGLSTSPSNSIFPDAKGAFLEITIGDDVRAQFKLINEKFGITELQLVCGWSMGAQQTYEWAARYPDVVKRAAPWFGTAKSPQSINVFTDIISEAIKSDPAWNKGFYNSSYDVHEGLRRHAKIFALLALTREFYDEELWKDVGFSSLPDFIRGFWENWFINMDPNNLLTMIGKWKKSDISKIPGYDQDLQKALGAIKAKVFVLAAEHDLLYTLNQHAYEQQYIPNSELRVSSSLWGHFAGFGVLQEDFDFINNNLKELLAIEV